MTPFFRAASLLFVSSLALGACQVADSSRFAFDAEEFADTNGGNRSSSGSTSSNGSTSASGRPPVGSVLGNGGSAASSPGRGGAGAGSSSSSSSSGGRAPAPGGGFVGAGLSPSTGQDCLLGAVRCDPTGRVAQSCGADGRWVDEACASVCRDGACTGVCVPGSRQCRGLTPQRCDDQGAWVDDGAACASACESGVCSGACTDGDTQCASGEEVQRCTDGAWGQSTACPFACMSDDCGGECRPGDTRCAGTREIETCSATGEWSFESTCDFVCSGKTCGGVCKPGAQRCASPTEVETCGATGEWQAATACSAACVGDKCGGVCKPGERRCGANGNAVETCNLMGVWESKACAAACVDGECSSCTPGEHACVSGTQQRMCNANGEWGPATQCEFACVTDRCGGVCKPGTRACVLDSTTPQFAECSSSGQWGGAMSCGGSPACVSGMCQEDPKLVFVTSQTFSGALGGLAGADAKCQAAASSAGLTGTFKAWLSDGTGSPSTRFSKQGGPYKLLNGIPIAASWNELITNGPITNINVTERGGTPPVAKPPTGLADVCGGEVNKLVWSSTTRSGTAQTEPPCANWTSTSAGKTGLGRWDDTKYWSAYCRVTTDSTNRCASTAPLYCFQQ